MLDCSGDSYSLTYISELFGSIDVNGDGLLSAAEMKEFLFDHQLSVTAESIGHTEHVEEANILQQQIKSWLTNY